MSNRNNFLGPNGATPVFDGGASFKNLVASANYQVKTGAGVFQNLGVNTGGTTSAAQLFDGISGIVTVTIASPGVISWTGHPFVAGSAVKLTSTGALPTGLTANTTYYVSINGLTANAFEVADTQAHALAGTNTVNTSGVQSGVHTAWDVSLPIGKYATTAQGFLEVGAAFSYGLIAIATDGGGAADLTVLYV